MWQIIQAILILSLYQLKENLTPTIMFYDYSDIMYIDIYRKKIREIIHDHNDAGNNPFLTENDYFYYFQAKYLNVYFYKPKNSLNHVVFFDGLSHIQDIIDIFISRMDKGIQNIHDEILGQKGIFYKICPEYIEELSENKNDLYEIFNNIYIDETSAISFYGYSFGGPLSLHFYSKLGEKKKNIKIYNIESWFEGDEKSYQQTPPFHKLYVKGSVFEYYNSLFQPYVSDLKSVISLYEPDDHTILKQNLLPIFPMGIYSYIKEHHSLKK